MPDFAPNARPNPTLVTGSPALRDPGQTPSQRLIADVQDEILLYMPSANPLTTLTGKIRKKREATQYRYDWLWKDEYPRSLTVSGAQTIGDVSIEVAAGHGVRVTNNYVLLNTRTREQVLVTGVAADVLTVTRGIGGIGAAMVDGDVLLFLRPVYEDGADIGNLKSIQEVDEFNYTEIIRTPFGFTGRQQNTDMFGGKDPMTETKAQGIEHAKSIEKMMFFGRRFSQTGPLGHLQTFSGGLEFFIQSNIWDLNGQKPSERSFVEFLEVAMRWGMGGYLQGSNTKYLFASRRWCTEIEFWAKDRIEYKPLTSDIGLSVGTYTSTHGVIKIVPTPILDYEHQEFAFLVDLNHVRYVAHQGRDTKLYSDRQGRGIDGEEREYISDVGCQVELEGAHSILKGLPA